ncbi:AsmA family protein [bacterium]|nr:AsmA family protein [bacterium]
MKKLKITGLILSSILLLIYLAFLLVLPNVININNYKADIQKAVEESAKLKLDFNSVKLYTHPLLKVGVKADSPSVTFPDGSELFKSKDIDLRVDILPLLAKKIKISKFQISSPEIVVDILDDGKYRFESLLVTDVPQEENSQEQTNNSQDFDFTILLSSALIDKYSLLVKDLKTGDILKLSGDDITVYDFNSAKHIYLGAKGSAYLNDNEDITFNFKVNYQVPKASSQPISSQNTEEEALELPNIVQLFKTYEPKTEIVSDLKITGEGDNTQVNGNLYVDKFSIKLSQNRLPDSFLKLDFNKQDIKINTDLYVADNEKMSVNGDVNYGKKTNIDLTCKSDKIYLKSILSLAKGVLDSMMVENDLDDFDVKGFITSDFNIKTDLKQISSNGKLNLSGGDITHKKSQLKVSDLKSTVNLENNSIKIEDTSAVVNDTKINVNGTIASDSKLDIKLFTDKLQIDKLFNAFAPVDLKKNYLVNSGFLTVNADLTGTLTEILPSANILLENLSLTDKINNFTLTNKQVNTVVKAQGENFNGDVDILSTNIRFPDFKLTLQNPNTSLKFDNKDLKLNPSDIYIEDSKFTLLGDVKNYMTKPDYKFQLKGGLKSSVIAGFLPKEVLGAVSYAGQLPLNFQISGDSAKLSVLGQVLADSNNHFSPVIVNKLLNKSSVVNLDMSLANNILSISDIGIYELPGNLSSLNDSLSNNIANAYRCAQVVGSVKNLDKKVQTLDNIKLNLPASLSLSTPLSKDSKLLLKGSLSANGSVNSPLVTGNINISDIALPEFSTTANSVDVNMSDSNINVKVSNLALDASKFNFELNMPQNFGSVVNISSFNLTSSNIDSDGLMVISDKIMKAMEGSSSSSSSSSASADIPAVISKGSIKVDKLTSGELVFTNIVSPLTLSKNTVYLNGMTLNAYDGTVSGDVSYNLITTLIKAKLSGSGVDANKFIGAAAMLKDQVFGTLKFNTDVSLSGATYEEQMKTLKGTADFVVENGKFGSLGSIETFLGANNLASQALISTKIGSVINTVVPYNSSEFKTLTGNVRLSDGNAKLEEIKSSGDNMSLYITGNMNLLNNNLQATLLGRLSSQLANALGPISSVSSDKLISSIPGVGSYALTLFKALTITADEKILAKIPPLTKESEGAKNFKVVLNGNVEKPAGLVKSFQWVQTSSEYAETKNNLSELLGNTTALKDSAKEIVNSLFKADTSTEQKNAVEGAESSPANAKQNLQKGVNTLFNIINEASNKVQE